MTIHLSYLATACVLLALTQAAHAWTAEDCNQPPFSRFESSVVKDCQLKSLIQQQPLQADGSQPTEAQRLERVREILRNQKLIQLSDVRDRSTPAKKRREAIKRCEPRLKDLLEGKGFEPIEPVFILDDVWRWDLNGVGELRVPAIWNSCTNAEDRTSYSINTHLTPDEREARKNKRYIRSFTGNRLRIAQPTLKAVMAATSD